MRRTRTLLSFLVLLLLVPPRIAVGLPVALPNPGAETVAEGRPDRPAQAGVWTADGVDATFRRDSSVSRSGRASFHIVNRGRTGGPADASQTALFSLEGDVLPGLTYTVSGYVKARDLERTAGFGLRLRSEVGWLDASSHADLVHDAPDWTRITARVTTPPGAARFALHLKVPASGEAWFDDIEMHDNLEAWCAERFGRLDRTLTAAGMTEAASDARRLLADSRDLDAHLPFAARQRFVEEAAGLERTAREHARAASINRAVARAEVSGPKPFVVGFAPSTVHVFLDELPVRMEVTSQHRILAVRGETEATQLVILAHREPLRRVRVTVEDMVGAAGTIAATGIAVKPVGFVQTTVRSGANPYPRAFDHTGWWPDPILENFPFDVKAGESQPVWISVNVPRTAAAGVYRGTIRIIDADGRQGTATLELEVADVTLPRRWRFRNLLSWHEHWARQFYGDRWNDALHERFIRFLHDRRINVISMYGDEPYATTENLIRFARRGQNTLMLASLPPEARVRDTGAAALRRRLDRMLPALDEAGVLDRGIVYGWDERGPQWYDEIRYTASLLQNEYEGIPLLMAGTDPTYGTDSALSGLGNIIYCPLMPDYDADVAARARANGNRVWWYEIWWIIEDPLIRSRLIPWQSFKVGADGFLFWCLNRFVGNDRPIFDPADPKIRTTWNPALDGGYENSTALYVYPGRDGPISSLRLENLRDGIEDYELLMMARDRLAGLPTGRPVSASQRDALRRAVTLEDTLVKDHAEYTKDPESLAHHRRMLIEALTGEKFGRSGKR